MGTENGRLLGLTEAANLLGIKPGTLRKWHTEGKISAIRVGSRGDRRFRDADVRALKHGGENTEWNEYLRNGLPLFFCLHAVDGIIMGLRSHFKTGLASQLCYFERTTLYWYYDRKDLYRLGHTITETLFTSPSFSDRFFAEWSEKTREILEFIVNNDYRNRTGTVSGPVALETYCRFDTLLSEWYGYSMVIDATDESMETDFRNKIKSTLTEKLADSYSEQSAIDAYEALTSASVPSAAERESDDILSLAHTIIQGRIGRRNDWLDRKTRLLAEKYWWVRSGWDGSGRETGGDIRKRVKEAIASGKAQIEKERVRLNERKIIVVKRRMKILSRYGFDTRMTDMIKLNERLTNLHDERKEVQMRTADWIRNFIDVVGKGASVPTSLLLWCDRNELKRFFADGTLDMEELNRRTSCTFRYQENDQVTLKSGLYAKWAYTDRIRHESEYKNDIQGTVASRGSATGRAFVALTPEAANKIPKGHILITGMTTPEYTPALKKSSALVTDEGGITCHAAIISRELDIPCIVGTREATRLIRSGDLITVSANHGVVRILERKSKDGR